MAAAFLALEIFGLGASVLVGRVLFRSVPEADGVVLMIAVIVALCVFFVVVVMVELLSGATRPTIQTRMTTPEETDEIRPVLLTSITTYWEEDTPGWWLLWNYDRKNLGLVAWQDTYVLWRVFTTDLLPSLDGYELVELEDLLEMGIRAIAPNELTPTIEGRVGSVEEAKRRVEATISYIWREHDRFSC